MQKNLVIVESPAKAKTIEKFLGKDYKVMSSYGHIRDLRKKNFGIDIEGGFKPEYEIPDDKKSLVKELKEAAKKAETIWLASDEDREGEAIAWHLSEVLGLDPKTTKRIVFHEITKDAILNAIKNPRAIDLHRVDAQQARRVLDRIVGFELSPVLWKKIKPALSAGRVQSVAVRLIVEREEEIKNFVPEQFYRVTAVFDAGNSFKAELPKRLADHEAASEFLTACKDATFSVKEVQVRPVHKSPAPPFTTSTLQQEASRKLGFTVSQTMMVAQRLYEAGHITYMRTDSLNLSSQAINAIKDEITTKLGAAYVRERHYHTHAKGAQEAHEAIRPTYINAETVEGTAQEKKLYQLIRRRAIASQMADAELEKTTVDIEISTRPEHLTATGEVIKFDGFLKMYSESRDDDNEAESLSLLPSMSAGDVLSLVSMSATERYTLQHPRYTEATLVKKMEELGIGRPSTYAPTISTIQQREYIEKGERGGQERTIETLTLAKGKITESTKKETFGAEKNKLIPTDIGMVVNRFLTEFFPSILDYNFTARVEERFDEIADGKIDWTNEMQQFYDNFHPAVEKALNLRMEHKVGERSLGQTANGEPVSVKIGRFGPLIQIGSNEGGVKPRFASLQKGQSVDTITLDEALKLFEFPKELGTYEDKAVTVGVGKFGPYVRHDGKFVSIPKGVEASNITLDEAIELINEKRESENKKVLKTFEEDADLQILNGRYGVYIVYKGQNYKIPRNVTEPLSLSHAEVLDIVNSQESKPRKTTRTTKKKA
ncbi:MAG: type I DNA topoisomerase [Muribaculaceae bacterium]|nr:type I DNA topoisomerase [Muribaculaceae bacterium]